MWSRPLGLETPGPPHWGFLDGGRRLARGQEPLVLLSALPGPHCVSLAGPCPSVELRFPVCEMEEALDQTVCHISFSFCDLNPTRLTLPALMGC